MAATEMYDYVSTVIPDNDVTLSTPIPQGILTEQGGKNQVVHLGDDGSEEVITLDAANIFYVTLVWQGLTDAESGIILDFYFSDSKGNGIAESFEWQHPSDGHTYVVKFRCDAKRTLRPPVLHAYPSVKFKVLGRILDA